MEQLLMLELQEVELLMQLQMKQQQADLQAKEKPAEPELEERKRVQDVARPLVQSIPISSGLLSFLFFTPPSSKVTFACFRPRQFGNAAGVATFRTECSAKCD